jgi:hypothetical protein
VKCWEYRVESFYVEEDPARRANVIGAEGWELVAIDRTEQWIFKRPVEDETLRPRIPPTMTAAAKKKALENGNHVREPAPARRPGRRQLS